MSCTATISSPARRQSVDSEGMVTVLCVDGTVFDDYCPSCLEDAHRGRDCTVNLLVETRRGV